MGNLIKVVNVGDPGWEQVYQKGKVMDETRREAISKWKKTSWLEFCKEVMIADPRFTIQPYTDYYNAPYTVKEGGTFGQMCLRRDGVLADVYILPPDPNLGFVVEAGSKYTKLSLHGFPSKAMVWPVTRASDELERQFTREVMIEATKHGTTLGHVIKKGGKQHGKPANHTTGNNDSNKLSANS